MLMKGKTVLITGGSRGIGLVTAEKFASLGANIAIASYASDEEFKSAEEALGKYGTEVRCYMCNVASFQEAKDVVQKVKADFGTIDVLVNNAGITRDNLIPFMKEEDFDAVLSVNLKGSFNMIKAVCGIFIRNKAGRIVNISSVSGMIGNPGQANYSASKAGLIGLTKTVAKEFSAKNITCNAVAPGFIETAMTKDLSIDHNALLSAVPLGRMGKPEEVADAVVFLASSDYITGEVLRVDGGVAM